MFKNLLLLGITAAIAYWGWKHYWAEPPTPEQQVAALVVQSVIPAADLAALCSKYPKLVTQALKGQRIAVSGILSKAQVSGVSSNDLSLELAGAPQLKIMFNSDFGKVERWGGPAEFRFQKRGKEIVAISVSRSSTPEESDKNHPEQVYSQIDSSNETAALQSMVGVITKAYGSSTSVGNKKKFGTKTPAKPVERALCREGDTLTLRGEFRNIAPGWVKCDLLELP